MKRALGQIRRILTKKQRRGILLLMAGGLVLALLGDQISGSIHASLISKNSENTVQQLKRACWVIASFIESLTEILKGE